MGLGGCRKGVKRETRLALEQRFQQGPEKARSTMTFGCVSETLRVRVFAGALECRLDPFPL